MIVGNLAVGGRLAEGVENKCTSMTAHTVAYADKSPVAFSLSQGNYHRYPIQGPRHSSLGLGLKLTDCGQICPCLKHAGRYKSMLQLLP